MSKQVDLNKLDEQVRNMIDENEENKETDTQDTENEASTEEESTEEVQVDEATAKSSEETEETKEDEESTSTEEETASADSEEKEEDEQVSKSSNIDINQMMQFFQSVVEMNTVLNEKVSKSETQISELRNEISDLNENVQKSLGGGDISTPQQVDPSEKLDGDSVKDEDEEKTDEEKEEEEKASKESEEVETDEETSKSADETTTEEEEVEAPESKSEFVAKSADGVTQPEADLEDAIGDGEDKTEEQAPAFDAHQYSKQLNDLFFKKASGMSPGTQTAFRHALARLRRNQETPDDESFFQALLNEK